MDFMHQGGKNSPLVGVTCFFPVVGYKYVIYSSCRMHGLFCFIFIFAVIRRPTVAAAATFFLRNQRGATRRWPALGQASEISWFEAFCTCSTSSGGSQKRSRCDEEGGRGRRNEIIYCTYGVLETPCVCGGYRVRMYVNYDKRRDGGGGGATTS